MSDAPATPVARKKGGLVRKLALFVVAPLVLIGGGVTGGLYAAGKGARHGAADDPNRPRLMLKGSGEHGTPDKGPEPAHVDPDDAPTPAKKPALAPSPRKAATTTQPSAGRAVRR